MALVSIIIPTYNQERFVLPAVESALAQQGVPVEVIVVDDGSTDGTRARLSPYLNRIEYLYQENRGVAAARNTGIRAARGDFLVFLDGDDLLLPQKCARQFARLEAHPACALVYSAWEQISEDGQRRLGEVHPNVAGQVLVPLLLRRFFFFPSAALVRRSCLEQVGLFDETIPWADDGDLWLRLALHYPFDYLDEPLLRYRIHEAASTSRVQAAQVQNWLESLRKFFARPDLPVEIRALEGEACSVLHFETSGRYFREGSIPAAQEHLRAGIQVLDRPVQPDWFLEWLAGTAADPRTGDPEAFIDCVFDHLVPEGASLASLRRRGHGRYHTAAAFAAYTAREYALALRHIGPAVQNEPSVLLNRGFLSMLLKSLVAAKGAHA